MTKAVLGGGGEVARGLEGVWEIELLVNANGEGAVKAGDSEVGVATLWARARTLGGMHFQGMSGRGVARGWASGWCTGLVWWRRRRARLRGGHAPWEEAVS